MALSEPELASATTAAAGGGACSLPRAAPVGCCCCCPCNGASFCCFSGGCASVRDGPPAAVAAAAWAAPTGCKLVALLAPAAAALSLRFCAIGDGRLPLLPPSPLCCCCSCCSLQSNRSMSLSTNGLNRRPPINVAKSSCRRPSVTCCCCCCGCCIMSCCCCCESCPSCCCCWGDGRCACWQLRPDSWLPLVCASMDTTDRSVYRAYASRHSCGRWTQELNQTPRELMI